MPSPDSSSLDDLYRRLQQHLDTYKSLTGEYPPDGIDTPQKNEKGERIVGSACLYYYLSRPVWQREMVAGKETRREHPPIASDLTDSELSDPDPDYPGVREILDGWKVPIHYDNTSNGRFRPQRGEVHYPAIDDEQHPPDPRDGPEEIEGEKAAPKHGIQGKGFDLWSHGYREHDMDATPTKPIASWNT